MGNASELSTKQETSRVVITLNDSLLSYDSKGSSKAVKTAKAAKASDSAFEFKVEDVKPIGEAFPKTKLGKIIEEKVYCTNKKQSMGMFMSREKFFGICSPCPEREIIDFGPVPVLSGLYQAYTRHCPICFSPDDIWLLILQFFSNYINENSEDVRHDFVKFEGKKTISVEIKNLERMESELDIGDYKDFICKVIDQIPSYIKPSLIDTLTPDFSTTDEDKEFVGKLTIMCSFKKYFDYEMMCGGCGIPSIKLKGTVEDWEKIKEKVEFLSKYKINFWLSKIKPIIDEFIMARKGNPNKDFWANMIKVTTINKKERFYDEVKTVAHDYIDGWILNFLPYNKDGNYNFVHKIEVKDINERADQMLSCPFSVHEIITDKNYPKTFYTGFIGVEQDKESREVSLVQGWFVVDQKNE